MKSNKKIGIVAMLESQSFDNEIQSKQTIIAIFLFVEACFEMFQLISC